MVTPGIKSLYDEVDWRFGNAQMIADLTGGTYFAHQARTVAAGMDRLDDATRATYILGYYPSNPTFDDHYREIKVIVNRPGASVQYRHGYFAAPVPPPADVKSLKLHARVNAAADYVPDITDIKVDATASLPKGSGRPSLPLSVQMEITVDASRLTLEKHDDHTIGSIVVAMFLMDGRDQTVGELWKAIDFSLTGDQLAAVRQEGARVRASVALQGLPKKAKIIVYDAGADLLGSRTVDVK
jgi:hypothetical protein